MAKTKTTHTEDAVSVLEISKGAVTFCVLGTSPLVFNRMSEKAKRELLMPRGRKNAAERATTLKHDPVQEFRDSVYRDAADNAPARLVMPATAFKGAMAAAALDLPGVARSQIGRLTYVQGYNVHVFGVPRLFMSVVRSADINKTPDIRTRAILPEWAAMVTISFVKPLIRDQMVANLLAAAGVTIGIGDFRQEKGKGNFGQFDLVSADSVPFQALVRKAGRDVQDKALTDATPYDAESAELLDWYSAERKKRGFDVKEAA